MDKDESEVEMEVDRLREKYSAHKTNKTHTHVDAVKPRKPFTEDLIVETLPTIDKYEIIDMTSGGKSVLSFPLSSLLAELAARKKRDRSTLIRKQDELDAALRELNRNIEEVRRERARLAEIERENEMKRRVQEFIGKERSGDIEEICNDIRTLELTVPSDSELKDKAIMTVICPVLKQQQPLDPDIMKIVKETLTSSLYSRIIYHLWWPVVKRNQFEFPVDDFDGWRSLIDFLREWAHLLPEDFLISFLGIQVLLPRLHNLLQQENKDDGFIAEIWNFCVNQLKLPTSLLNDEIVSWFTQRISQVQVKHFQKLLKEFREEWHGKGLFSGADDVKRIKLAWYQRIQRLLQRDLVIDPVDQDLLPLECVLEYTKAVEDRGVDSEMDVIAKLIHDHLIPKLKRCVQSWLRSPQVDYDEVADWYVAWKEIIPEKLREKPVLLEGFAQILGVINENI